MKKINKYTSCCPSSSDFDVYLTGKGSDLFSTEFESHLKECEFCNEAVQGYKVMLLAPQKTMINSNLFRNNIQPRLLLNWIGYAASIAMIFGLMFLGNKQITNKSLNRNMAVVDFESDYIPQQNKHLSHKSSGNYWFVGREQNIAVNDQLINDQQIINAIKAINTSRVYIQFESNNNVFNQRVIQTIKSETSASVLSY